MFTPAVPDLNAIAYDKLPDTGDGDRVGIVMFIRSEKFKKEANQSSAKWMHKMASRFNDPANGVVAAASFEAHCQDLVRYACSHQVPEEVRQDPNKFKLDGNSGFAQAVKKLIVAMNLGADLLSDDCSTVSKCVKWSKEKKAEIEAAEKKRLLLEHLKAKGIDPESPEGLRLLGLPSDQAVDPISLALRSLEDEMRKHIEVAPEGQTLSMVSALIDRFKESTAALIADINAKAAKFASNS